jgi:P-type conjugative transfer protein TrbJ
MMKKVLLGGLLLLALCPSTGWPVFGVGDIVVDLITEAQTSLTAIRTLASNVNEVKMINQQVKQLANDAQNLATLPLSVVGEVQQAMTTATNLMNQGRAMAYQAKASLDNFDKLFTNGHIPFSERAQAIFNEIRNTSRLASELQSVYDVLCANTARVEQLTNASQAAVGILQAEQAGNQLLGVLASQQNGMHQLQANTARLQTLVYMQGVVEDEAAKQHAQNMLKDWPTTLGGVTGFKLP